MKGSLGRTPELLAAMELPVPQIFDVSLSSEIADAFRAHMERVGAVAYARRPVS
ncbi:MAG: hypothetical protein ACP5NF_11120 [Thermoanaerobaculum sp.]